MQPVDFTTLTAICADLRSNWLPARLEQVYQCDRYTLAIALRTLTSRQWLTLSWHPQAARICIGDPPPKTPDTFTFSDQLRHQLNGYALIAINAIAPWERVIDFQFAKRPGEAAIWHLYGEIMGKYSNIILTDANNQIVTVAHQVTANQSSVRTVETGQIYELPPPLMGTKPSLNETQDSWQARISLVPGKLQKQLLNSYRGLSPTVAREMIEIANLKPNQSTDSLTELDWTKLYQYWQAWLNKLETGDFQPGWLADGNYTVLGWRATKPANIHNLLHDYYTNHLNREQFQQLRHQLQQKLNNLLAKLQIKADGFKTRLKQADKADLYRQQADLLLAYLHQWQPGMTSITLNDFATDEPVQIPLNPEKNGVQNSQFLYKQHQKLKRARNAVEPLLKEVLTEIEYLRQVQASLNQIEQYQHPDDLQTLTEIREELIQQNYLASSTQRNTGANEASQPHRYRSPSGFELWIGRNNRQNDQLTFRIAGDYDLWFHTQEIPGSHVLLRLTPGSVPEPADLQMAADWAAYYSQARQSEQVPVVYTEPKSVYKPKGAKPGMVVYKRERVLWGNPHKVLAYLINSESN